MKATIVPIGNSKRVRIPKTFLTICHIGKEAEMSLQGDAILLKPVRTKPRHDWAKKFKAARAIGEDEMLIDDNLDLDFPDWVW